ncbi:hypothetical protein RvY_02235 [Ramazzottius varieornatus]|uniref:Secreted protein n=1 Tax=Ramazzottius varieornatus TaxID=947166 RepID=A0A1D1UJU6_RAMVA|nr:hypothetical protein RvY_02235 [Ramazzottius varieornatus]
MAGCFFLPHCIIFLGPTLAHKQYVDAINTNTTDPTTRRPDDPTTRRPDDPTMKKTFQPVQYS